MRIRLVIIIVFAALLGAGYVFPRIALNATPTFSPQVNRKKQTGRTVRRRNQSRSQRKPARDYSQFSHRSAKHQSLACDACHKAPTANWLKASAFPDVADYPSHASCIKCHRTEFFKGARPLICSVCHTKVSPRDEARFDFEKPNQPSQFSTIFPHDKHQDVIASDRFKGEPVAAAHALRSAPRAQDKSRAQYYNCAVCHQTEAKTPNPPGGFPDNFMPPAGTFKAAPVGHASCYNCHWKNQEPTHNDCAGCHKLSETDVAMRLAPKRNSLKFAHEPLEAHIAECASCHINITRESSLLNLKPDVPITSCSTSSCHLAQTQTEFEQRKLDSSFGCVKCHTSDVGKRPVPASHSALFTE
ncbi:MAG: hypothetical protein H7Y30_17115 [Pyrinomonadaceae bacterium]|nr:hypothetical protein [Pyrinomonadaceae bacterium]